MSAPLRSAEDSLRHASRNTHHLVSAWATDIRAVLATLDRERAAAKALREAAEEAADVLADLIGEGVEDHPDDMKVIIKIGRMTSSWLTLGDLRKTHAALAGSKP